MEPFLAGGLFEILIASGFALFLNFIFLKRQVLLIFSVLIICPILLYFLKEKNELHIGLLPDAHLTPFLFWFSLQGKKRKSI
jgi:hypothetical protein